MTKTHAELLPCPHCGEKPVHKGNYTPGSSHSPPEYDEEIYCTNLTCIPNQSLECWNTRINKEAKFLDQLKAELKEWLSDDWPDSQWERADAYGEIISHIEQFQAEQKQVGDEQK